MIQQEISSKAIFHEKFEVGPNRRHSMSQDAVPIPELIPRRAELISGRSKLTSGKPKLITGRLELISGGLIAVRPELISNKLGIDFR